MASSMSEGPNKSSKGWKRLEPDRIEATVPVHIESEKAEGVPIPKQRTSSQ
jgi:hypothetical protein